MSVVFVVLGAGLPVAAAEPDFAEADFRQRVAPLLTARCVGCHQGDAPEGGLSLESRAALLRGGDSGPAVDLQAAESSLLLQQIGGSPPAMPAEGPPLSAAEVSLLREWVAAGAPWPEEVRLEAARVTPLADEPWWSWRPLACPPLPALAAGEQAWQRTPVDGFIAARLAREGMPPSPEADRRTLIRRLTFDLHGLPPTPEEVSAFESDDQPEAYERLVDRLLASPRYAERWARHWLDVVHYGETHGYDKDKRRPHAWRYRDYVIDAFHRDLPYGQFLIEQVAGDVWRPDDPAAIVATGFLAAGPWDFVGHAELAEGTVEKEKTRYLDRDDVVANTFATFTSLTVHCARCHAHKFDPIGQAEYYGLQAVFAGIDRGDRPVPALGEGALAYAVNPVAPRVVHVLARGDVEAPQDEAQPGALELAAGLGRALSLESSGGEGARRLALARWLADERNGIVWRSIANRVWHYHFGRGIVDTPNDFGHKGSQPTHPELLDWLACELRDHGQSLKHLHRRILHSATYRQSSSERADLLAVDADNRLLGRMSRRRLEAEAIRDAVLAVSGKLDLRMGGPSFEPFEFEDDHSPRYRYVALDRPDQWRRTVYRCIVRSVPQPFLEVLDCPDPSASAPARASSITALQALALLNNPLMVRQAEYLAERVAGECPAPATSETQAIAEATLRQQVTRAMELALSRRPEAEETAALARYARRHGLAATCRWIFNTNEFLFVD